MTDSLNDIARRTIVAAQALSLAAEVRPELTSSEFRGGMGEDALRGSHLPLQVAAVMIGRYPILFGDLPISADVALVRDSMRRYRNQCVVARSYLPPERTLDLQLWLLGPAGSDDDVAWQSLALAIERDDRVARKLVWLPPTSLEKRDVSFAAFIARTFLARPWDVLPAQPSAQLDRLSALLTVASDLGIEQSVLQSWFRLADSDLADGAELIDALVDAWSRGAP